MRTHDEASNTHVQPLKGTHMTAPETVSNGPAAWSDSAPTTGDLIVPSALRSNACAAADAITEIARTVPSLLGIEGREEVICQLMIRLEDLSDSIVHTMDPGGWKISEFDIRRAVIGSQIYAEEEKSYV